MNHASGLFLATGATGVLEKLGKYWNVNLELQVTYVLDMISSVNCDAVSLDGYRPQTGTNPCQQGVK